MIWGHEVKKNGEICTVIKLLIKNAKNTALCLKEWCAWLVLTGRLHTLCIAGVDAPPASRNSSLNAPAYFSACTGIMLSGFGTRGSPAPRQKNATHRGNVNVARRLCCFVAAKSKWSVIIIKWREGQVQRIESGGNKKRKSLALKWRMGRLF